MAQTNFSFTWKLYKNNISESIGAFQQNGEFVDMTLAADGHFVKVHRVIMACASPYIKDLISSIECPHPVIFLNKISYRTLCSILEYIYTGEVLVPTDCISEFAEASRELHIRGLVDLDTNVLKKQQSSLNPKPSVQDEPSAMEHLSARKEQMYTDDQTYDCQTTDVDDNTDDDMKEQTDLIEYDPPELEISSGHEYIKKSTSASCTELVHNTREHEKTNEQELDQIGNSMLQYTLSTHGKLRLILNRYIYYVRHAGLHGKRNWRCIEYIKRDLRCRATVFTVHDRVVRRVGAHNHPFHDATIFKKIQSGSIFSAINEAEEKMNENDRKSEKK